MSAADWIGIVGGITGLIALALQTHVMWLKRRPKFKLYLPYRYSGAIQNTRVLFILMRLSNLSERNAHIYFETLTAEALYKGRWYQMQVELSSTPSEQIIIDLPDSVKNYAGVNDIPRFNKFDNGFISLDNPYSRYIALTCAQREVVEMPERVRFEFQDCNLFWYSVEGEVLLENDPEHSRVKQKR